MSSTMIALLQAGLDYTHDKGAATPETDRLLAALIVAFTFGQGEKVTKAVLESVEATTGLPPGLVDGFVKEYLEKRKVA